MVFACNTPSPYKYLTFDLFERTDLPEAFANAEDISGTLSRSLFWPLLTAKITFNKLFANFVSMMLRKTAIKWQSAIHFLRWQNPTVQANVSQSEWSHRINLYGSPTKAFNKNKFLCPEQVRTSGSGVKSSSSSSRVAQSGGSVWDLVSNRYFKLILEIQISNNVSRSDYHLCNSKTPLKSYIFDKGSKTSLLA